MSIMEVNHPLVWSGIVVCSILPYRQVLYGSVRSFIFTHILVACEYWKQYQSSYDLLKTNYILRSTHLPYLPLVYADPRNQATFHAHHDLTTLWQVRPKACRNLSSEFNGRNPARINPKQQFRLSCIVLESRELHRRVSKPCLHLHRRKRQTILWLSRQLSGKKTITPG